jgi:hypothetical protein
MPASIHRTFARNAAHSFSHKRCSLSFGGSAPEERRGNCLGQRRRSQRLEAYMSLRPLLRRFVGIRFSFWSHWYEVVARQSRRSDGCTAQGLLNRVRNALLLHACSTPESLLREKDRIVALQTLSIYFQQLQFASLSLFDATRWAMQIASVFCWIPGAMRA